MTATYEKIATNTLGSAATSITFSSISSSYTDLILVMQIASNSSNTLFARFNGDSATNYSTTRLSGTGSSGVSDKENNSSTMALSNYAYPLSTLGNTTHIFQVFNYSNTTTYKTAMCRANSASNGVDATVNLWRSTSAITSVGISTNGFGGTSSLLTGSTFTLYGIKAE
jgi:hypothetical protein